MYFDYFEMLSGEPIPVNGVGHIKSPSLRDIFPTSGIGYKGYNLYLNVLTWDKERLLKYIQILRNKDSSKLDRENFLFFDIATLLEPTRELCRGMLSFFMVEQIEWDEKNRSFVAFVDLDGRKKVVGRVNRDNFDKVREMMLQANFIGLNKDSTPIRHSDEKTKELWERAQKYLEDLAKADNGHEEKAEYRMGNIVSKLSSVHPSYNLLNVFDLTVFQLYDAFFQVGYLRSANLSERIFSNHGGEKFNFEDWLKPILNYE